MTALLARRSNSGLGQIWSDQLPNDTAEGSGEVLANLVAPLSGLEFVDVEIHSD
jgi:hypothetical protein